MDDKDSSDTTDGRYRVKILEDPNAREPPVDLFARMSGRFLASNQFRCTCGNTVTVSKKKAQKFRKMKKPNVKCKRCKKVQKVRRRI